MKALGHTHVCRSAQNGLGDLEPLRFETTVPFARNDLLLTMSDNTRHADTSWRSISACANSCFLTDEQFESTTAIAGWWSQTGSNRRPPACKAGALPAELWPLASILAKPETAATAGMVGLGRFELPTSRLSSARSNQLSYRPNPCRAKRSMPRPKSRHGATGAPMTLF